MSSSSTSTTLHHHPLAEAIKQGFTEDALKQFQQDGYCILKDVVDEKAAQSYLDEILFAFDPKNASSSSAQPSSPVTATTPSSTTATNQKDISKKQQQQAANANNALKQQQALKNPYGRFEPNKVEFLLASGPIQLVKPHVFECDLHKPEQRKGLSHFEKIFDSFDAPNSCKNGDADQITEIVNERFPEMKLSNSSNSHNSNTSQHITLKLQVNNGGAFPLHHDNPGPPNKRRLTLALYLTKDWTAETHGGQLVLQPFLGKEVIVPPVFNTLCLFRSDLVSHRVMPAKLGSTRYCFTIWFDSHTVNPDDEVNLRAKHLTPEFIPTLKISPIHRSLMRAVYDEEFRSSLKDCFGEGTRELLISIKMHEAHTAPLLKNPTVAAFVNVLRQLKNENQIAE